MDGVLLILKLLVEACNFTKSITLPWVFFMSFKLYKLCQIDSCNTSFIAIANLYEPFVLFEINIMQPEVDN